MTVVDAIEHKAISASTWQCGSKTRTVGSMESEAPMPADLDEPLTFQLSTGALRSMTNELWNAIWTLGERAAIFASNTRSEEIANEWYIQHVTCANLLCLHPSYLGV